MNCLEYLIYITLKFPILYFYLENWILDMFITYIVIKNIVVIFDMHAFRIQCWQDPVDLFEKWKLIAFKGRHTFRVRISVPAFKYPILQKDELRLHTNKVELVPSLLGRNVGMKIYFDCLTFSLTYMTNILNELYCQITNFDIEWFLSQSKQ